jgi:DNA-binding NarL/FixJ family response regulator
LQNCIIVDDSDILRERLKTLITPNKNIKIVGEASNSIDAMQLLSNLSIDILFLDIHMPGSNGFKVLTQIRNSNKKIKIIIITNYPTMQYRTAAFEMGANYFVDKSEEFEKIPTILNEIVLSKAGLEN